MFCNGQTHIRFQVSKHHLMPEKKLGDLVSHVHMSSTDVEEIVFQDWTEASKFVITNVATTGVWYKPALIKNSTYPDVVP